MTKISVIITAGGTGSRYGVKNKLLETVFDKKVIEYAVEKFFSIGEVSEIVISAHSLIIPDLKKIFKDKVKIIEGGQTRQQSVYNGLKTVSNSDYVLIHDGARPLVKTEDIKKLISEVKIKDAVILAVKTVDTIKKVNKEGKIISTVDRSDLYNVQTPQGFKSDLIFDAHKKLEGQNFTDDAGMLEALGYDVFVAEGSYDNFKITTKEDISKMKAILNV